MATVIAEDDSSHLKLGHSQLHPPQDIQLAGRQMATQQGLEYPGYLGFRNLVNPLSIRPFSSSSLVIGLVDNLNFVYHCQTCMWYCILID
jgi:hypothetical protein